MAVPREVNESPVYQGINEQLVYTVTTTPWGSTPATLVNTLWDITDADNPSDVSSTKLTGSTNAAGDVITTKKVYGLTLNSNYRLDVKFTDSASNIWEAYLIIKCR